MKLTKNNELDMKSLEYGEDAGAVGPQPKGEPQPAIALITKDHISGITIFEDGLIDFEGAVHLDFEEVKELTDIGRGYKGIK